MQYAPSKAALNGNYGNNEVQNEYDAVDPSPSNEMNSM
jgi:hypothetical protein